ncbi:MAG: FAD-dependent monooxygenase [Chromatiales bacterium]|nr:FAD-dependent monooxygenase [Chromatiales bacterium]
MTHLDCDILVVGGGLPGLLLARQLGLKSGAKPWRVIVLDGLPAPKPEAVPPWGLRVFAIAPAVEAGLRAAGAWEQLPAGRVGYYRRMHVWQQASTADGAGSLDFDAADLGATHLGAIVEHDLLRAVLWELVGGTPGVETCTGELAAVPPVASDGHWLLQLADGRRVTARLVVGADGGASQVRSLLGAEGPGWTYGQQAIVAHVASERPHAATAWQCFRTDGPVALLPLADGHSSIVWSVPDARADALLALPDEDFAAELTAATDGVLGALSLTTPRRAFPLAARHTPHYTGARFALVGDAAHQVHPLAGQGVNLGLHDALALAARLAEHRVTVPQADPGDRRVLRRYERERKGDNLATLATIDGLHRLFAASGATVARAAGLGLGLVDRAPVLKRWLARRAMGAADRARS